MSTLPKDRRRTAANARVAALSLQGKVTAKQFVSGSPRQVVQPVVDLLRSPQGSRDRQLLFGDTVTLFDTHDGRSFVQADKDGYVGYVLPHQLGPVQRATHRVIAPATHVYSKADFKSPERHSLSFDSRIAAIGQNDRFTETHDGFVPNVHVQPIETLQNDPAQVAQIFLGTPYLWGGNSRWGIDCSGLVQAACLACGIPCPGDSDMQENELGRPLDKTNSIQRNDLIFWRGHVALAVSESTLIHANAAHMAVTFEDIETAISRIEQQGDGPVTRRNRLPASGDAT